MDLADPKGAGAAQVAPASENTPKYVEGVIVEGVGDSIGKGMAAYYKAQKDEEKKQVMTYYSQEMEKINSAMATGQMTPDQADTYARKVNATYMSKFADHITELKSAYDFAKEGTNLKYAENAVAEQKARQKEILDAASKDYGIITYPGMSQERIASITETVEASRAFERAQDRQFKVNAENRAQSEEQRKQTDWQRQQDSRKALQELGNAHYKEFTSMVQDISTQVRSGKMTYEQGQAMLTSRFAALNNAVSLQGANDQGYLGVWKDNFSKLHELGQKLIDPKQKSEEVQAQLKQLEASYKLKFMSTLTDKEQIQYGFMKEFDHPTIQFGLSPAILDLTKRVAGMPDTPNPYAPRVFGTPDEQGFTKVVLGGVDQANKLTGKEKDAAIDNSARAVNQYLKQATLAPLYKGGVDSKDYKTLVDTVLSPQFKQLRDEGRINIESLHGLKKIFEMGYSRDIRQNVLDRLDAKVTDGTDGNYRGQSVKDYVDIQFDGNGVKFAPKRELDPEAPLGSHLQQRDLMGNLRSSEAGVNKMLKLGAVLEGEPDLRKYWDEHKHELLPGYFMKGYEPGKAVPGHPNLVFMGGDARDQRNYTQKKVVK